MSPTFGYDGWRYSQPTLALSYVPTAAEIKVPLGLPAGTYDLVLYDEAQEIVRRPAALTVVGPPPVILQVVGSFLELSTEDAKRIQVGSTIGVGEVQAVGAPLPGIQRVLVNNRVGAAFVDTPLSNTVQLPVIMRSRCALLREQCHIGDIPLVRDAVVHREAFATAVNYNVVSAAFSQSSKAQSIHWFNCTLISFAVRLTMNTSVSRSLSTSAPTNAKGAWLVG